MQSQTRGFWPSNLIFILAAVGSAAGIGNLWRFPAMAFEHGGGAFVLALIIANVVIGLPLLLMEVGLGQRVQTGAAEAMAAVKRNARFIGWTAVAFGMTIVTYYMAVVSWSANYLVAAPTLAWGTNTEAYFFNEVLQVSGGVGELGGVSLPVLAGLVVTWILLYFCVWKSVRSISKVVVWTATLPLAILAILIIRTVTLPGAAGGLAAFFVPELVALADPQLWMSAFSQVFFTLSLAFGVMIAYGSFKQQGSEITRTVLWVVLGNLLVSIMAGIVIFGTLGYMAQEQGVAISEVVAGGPSLAFVVFPQAINLLPAFSGMVGVLFFATFILLAFDSAFSLLEAFATTIRDRLPHLSSETVTLAISLIGGIVGIMYTTGAGIFYLDIVDHFIVNYGLVAIGALEAAVIGWSAYGRELKTFIADHSAFTIGWLWDASLKVIAPVFLTILLIYNLVQDFRSPYEGYPIWALLTLGLGALVLAPLVGFVIDRLTSGTHRGRGILQEDEYQQAAQQ